MTANFTSADAGKTVVISGASNPGNNTTNILSTIISATKAMLHKQVTAEGPGFTAVVQGAAWKVSVLIDDNEEYACTLDAGLDWTTEDMAVNVAQLSGTHKVALRYTLDFV